MFIEDLEIVLPDEFTLVDHWILIVDYGYCYLTIEGSDEADVRDWTVAYVNFKEDEVTKDFLYFLDKTYDPWEIDLGELPRLAQEILDLPVHNYRYTEDP